MCQNCVVLCADCGVILNETASTSISCSPLHTLHHWSSSNATPQHKAPNLPSAPSVSSPSVVFWALNSRLFHRKVTFCVINVGLSLGFFDPFPHADLSSLSKVHNHGLRRAGSEGWYARTCKKYCTSWKMFFPALHSLLKIHFRRRYWLLVLHTDRGAL